RAVKLVDFVNLRWNRLQREVRLVQLRGQLVLCRADNRLLIADVLVQRRFLRGILAQRQRKHSGGARVAQVVERGRKVPAKGGETPARLEELHHVLVVAVQQAAQ